MSDSRPNDGYPTREEIEEYLNAYQRDGQAGIAAFLRKQEQQIGKDHQSCDSTKGTPTEKNKDR